MLNEKEKNSDWILKQFLIVAKHADYVFKKKKLQEWGEWEVAHPLNLLSSRVSKFTSQLGVGGKEGMIIGKSKKVAEGSPDVNQHWQKAASAMGKHQMRRNMVHASC